MLEIVEVWATLDRHRSFPYVDIYDNEERAKEDVGKVLEGISIDGIEKGWCVKGSEFAQDFHYTYEEALAEKDNLSTEESNNLFAKTFSTPYTDHEDKIGKEFTVISEKDRNSYDFEDVGVMYNIKFSDGLIIEAFPEEVLQNMR